MDTVTPVAFKLASLHAGPFVFASRWIGTAARSPWIYAAILGYLGAFAMWMTLLEHAPVGPAFAVSHIDVVTVLLVSVPLFGERLTVVQIGGAACIVAGIVFLSRAENEGEHSAAGAPRATTGGSAPESPAGHRAR